MTFEQKFVLYCDSPHCEATVITDFGSANNLDFGKAVSDVGWDIEPDDPQTWCPLHRKHQKNRDFKQGQVPTSAKAEN